MSKLPSDRAARAAWRRLWTARRSCCSASRRKPLSSPPACSASSGRETTSSESEGPPSSPGGRSGTNTNACGVLTRPQGTGSLRKSTVARDFVTATWHFLNMFFSPPFGSLLAGGSPRFSCFQFDSEESCLVARRDRRLARIRGLLEPFELM